MGRTTTFVLVALLALVAAVIAAPAADVTEKNECGIKLENYTAICKEELKASDADAEAMMMPPKNGAYGDKTKCLIKCVAERFGIFKEGQLVDSVSMAMIKDSKQPAQMRELALQIYNKCKTQEGEDECDTAGALHKCVMEEAYKAFPGTA